MMIVMKIVLVRYVSYDDISSGSRGVVILC